MLDLSQGLIKDIIEAIRDKNADEAARYLMADMEDFGR